MEPNETSALLEVLMPDPSHMANTSPKAVNLPLIPSSAVGLNPLIRPANPLLELATLVHSVSAYSDIEGLRYQICQMIKVFEQEGRAYGIDIEKLGAARYCLCTFLDESIASTSWGSEVWSSHSLLVMFHNEAFGGERFFLILQQLAQQPAANKDVLELIYVILALGFEGRYRLINGGRTQLDLIRQRLGEMIYSSQPKSQASVEHALSPHWRPVERQSPLLLRPWPVCLTALLTGMGLAVVYLTLSFCLHRMMKPVLKTLHDQHLYVGLGIIRPILNTIHNQLSYAGSATAEIESPETPMSTHSDAPKLATSLAPEIKLGLLSVNQATDHALLTIQGDDLFASGSAEIKPIYIPLLFHIGDILKSVPGRVVIDGHTDNLPINNLSIKRGRFQSNWQLPQARAEAVRDLLVTRTGLPARFTAQGKADSEPLTANDTALNRARNRRVSIAIFTPSTN